MTPEIISLLREGMGCVLGIFVSIPASLALLLALTRKRDVVTEYVRTVQGEVVERYPQLGEGK